MPNNISSRSFLHLGLRDLPNLLPNPATMEADSEDKEDTCQDSDKSSQGGHHPSSPLHNQDQGGAEGLSRSYHDHGEAVELFNDEVWN